MLHVKHFVSSTPSVVLALGDIWLVACMIFGARLCVGWAYGKRHGAVRHPEVHPGAVRAGG